MFNYQIFDRICQQSSWAIVANSVHTPPTPTRRDSTVESHRSRRCVLTVQMFSNRVLEYGHCNEEIKNLHVKIWYAGFCCLLRPISLSSLQVFLHPPTCFCFRCRQEKKERKGKGKGCTQSHKWVIFQLFGEQTPLDLFPRNWHVCRGPMTLSFSPNSVWIFLGVSYLQGGDKISNDVAGHRYRGVAANLQPVISICIFSDGQKLTLKKLTFS